MRVHLIKEKTVENFAHDHALSKAAFEDWLLKIKTAVWESPQDILTTFGSADLLGRGSKRVIFNIGGNNYRMICKYQFGEKEIHLYICWIGSHNEYDKICNKNEQYTITWKL